jgi:hypothetical protein
MWPVKPFADVHSRDAHTGMPVRQKVCFELCRVRRGRHTLLSLRKTHQE